ncbi:hypothetical protein, partial [Staphylococcus pseudintermedius]|uniref:hypothetical protein n=1 Tax=Staphylococcus pseudintermedius TaxID=283734 RepID=UPI001EE6E929
WERESIEAIAKGIIHIKEDKYRKMVVLRPPRDFHTTQKASLPISIEERSFLYNVFHYFNIFLKIVRLLHGTFP